MPKAKSRKRDNQSLRVALLQRTPQKYVAALKMNKEENPEPTNNSISSSSPTNNFENILNDSSKANKHQLEANELDSVETSLEAENTITSMDSIDSNKFRTSLNDEEKENLSSLDNSGFRKALLKSNEEEIDLEDTLINLTKEQNINSESNSKSSTVSNIPNAFDESGISNTNCSTVDNSIGFQKALMTSNEETLDEEKEGDNDITLVSSTTVSPNINNDTSLDNDSTGFQKILSSSDEEIQQKQKREIELKLQKEKQKSEFEKSKKSMYKLIINLKSEENKKCEVENKSNPSSDSKVHSPSNLINPSCKEKTISNNNLPSTSEFQKDSIEEDKEENEKLSDVGEATNQNDKLSDEIENSSSLNDSVGFGNALKSANEIDDKLKNLVSISDQDHQISQKKIISKSTEAEITINKVNQKEKKNMNRRSSSRLRKSETSSKTLKNSTIHEEENDETDRNLITNNTELINTINPSIDEDKDELNNKNNSTVNYTSGFRNDLMSTIGEDIEENDQSKIKMKSKSSEEKENSSLHDSLGFGNVLRSSNETNGNIEESNENIEESNEKVNQKLSKKIVSTDTEITLDKESNRKSLLNKEEKNETQSSLSLSKSKTLLNTFTETTIHHSHEETNKSLLTINNTSGFRNALMSTDEVDEEENEKSKSSEEKENSSVHDSLGFGNVLRSSNEADENSGTSKYQTKLQKKIVSNSTDAENIIDKSAGKQNKKQKGLFSRLSKSKSFTNSWIETTFHQSNNEEKEESNKNISTVNNTSGFRNAQMSTCAMSEEENEKSKTTSRNDKSCEKNDNLLSLNNSTGFRDALLSSHEVDENSVSSNDEEIFEKKKSTKLEKSKNKERVFLRLSKSKTASNSCIETTLHQSNNPEKDESNKNISTVNNTSGFRNALMSTDTLDEHDNEKSKSNMKSQPKITSYFLNLKNKSSTVTKSKILSNSFIETRFHPSHDEDKEQTNNNFSTVNNTSGFQNALMSSDDNNSEISNDQNLQKFSKKNILKLTNTEKIIGQTNEIEKVNVLSTKSNILSNTLTETTIYQIHQEENEESHKNFSMANNTSGFQNALISLNEPDDNIYDLVPTNDQDHSLISKSTEAEMINDQASELEKTGNRSHESLAKSKSIPDHDDKVNEGDSLPNSLINTLNPSHEEEKEDSNKKNISSVNRTSGFRNALMLTKENNREQSSAANSKTSMLVTMISTPNSTSNQADEENDSEEEENLNPKGKNKENEKLSKKSKEDKEKDDKFAKSSVKPIETSLFIKEISSRGHSTERKRPKTINISSSWIKSKRVKNSTAMHTISAGYDDWDGISVLSSISSHSAVTMDQTEAYRHGNEIENGIPNDYQRELKKELNHLLKEKQKLEVYTKIDKLATNNLNTTETNKNAKKDNNRSERNKRSNTIKDKVEVKKRKIQSKVQDPDLLVNNKKYSGRLKKPAKWASERLYKFLQSKCESRRKSEEIVLFLHQTLKKLPQTRPSDNYDKRALDLVEQIKKKLYKNSIIKTFWDLVIFFNEYLPSELSQKALPSVEFTEKGTRNIGPPMTQKTIFEPLNKYYDDNSDDSDDPDFVD